MALVRCPDCTREVSEAAARCPHCGYPLRPSLLARSRLVRGYAILAGVAIGALAIWALLGRPPLSDFDAGMRAMLEERPTAAEMAFERAVRAEPTSIEAWSNLAAARLRLANGPGAEEAARRAVELWEARASLAEAANQERREAAGAVAYGNLAAALVMQLRFEEAAQAARRALELDPAHPRAANLRMIAEGVRAGQRDASRPTAW